MMRPNQKAHHSNGHARERNPLIAKQGFASENGQQFADDAESWQDEDIHGWMGIEPEKVLEQQHFAA